MRRVVTIGRDVQAPAKADAAALRAGLERQGVFVVNVLSSPGSGKTSLLEALARHWRGKISLATMVGDLATDRDAQRLAPFMPVVQLTTGGACHLELPLVERGLESLRTEAGDAWPPQFLFIENVGNLVCTASHDLGEHLRVVLLSATEGDDKPGKYPKMFRGCQALAVTKIDLLPYVPFSVEQATADARRIQPELAAFSLSARDGAGIPAFCEYLERVRSARLY